MDRFRGWRNRTGINIVCINLCAIKNLFMGNQKNKIRSRKTVNALAFVLALIVFVPSELLAYKEQKYQSEWCSTRGQMEVVMPDGSRADCANATHVVEFDFARKWAESIGQALNYGAQSGKTPGIVLILERPGDWRYLERVRTVRETYSLPLGVWAVGGDGNELP